jgi:hypothetical protein
MTSVSVMSRDESPVNGGRSDVHTLDRATPSLSVALSLALSLVSSVSLSETSKPHVTRQIRNLRSHTGNGH